MKKRTISFLSFLTLGIILVSCNNSTPLVDQKPLADSLATSLAVENNVDTSAVFNYKTTVLDKDHESEIIEKFSNDSTEDTFTVLVGKGLISKTKTTLRVKNKSGKIVYEHVFSTTELINEYDLGAIKSDKDMVDYIIKKAGDVIGKGLVDLNHLNPEDYLSVATKEQFTNYELFLDMKAEGRRLLNYTLNQENHYYLGYSDKDKKVVTIIECC